MKKLLSLFIAVALILGVTSITPATALADGEADAADSGITFYSDSDFTKKLSPSIDLSGEYEVQLGARINVPKKGEKKIYLRIKDSDTEIFRESDRAVDLVELDGEFLDYYANSEFISYEKAPSYTDTDKRYIVTLHGTDKLEYSRLNVHVQSKYSGYDVWEDYAFGSDLYIDYVDEGLMISDPINATYSYYYGEGTPHQAPSLYAAELDFSTAYAHSVPGNNEWISLAVYRDGVLTPIKSQKDFDNHIKIYKSDGVSEVTSGEFDIEKYFPASSTDTLNDGVFFTWVSDEVSLGTSYIIRYTNGDYTSDLTYTAKLPVIGMYSSPKMSAKTYIHDAYYTEGKSYTTYILTDKKLENPTIQIQTDYINYADDALNYNDSYENIIDSDGAYGIELKRAYDDLPGPAKLTFSVSYTENNITKKAKGFAFIDVMYPEKGDTKIIDGNTYKITKLRKGNTLGTVSLIKTKKNRKSDKIPYTVTIASDAYYVKSIGKNAYKNNKKLTQITIGKAVTTIGENAFSGCKKLKKITLNSSKIKTVAKGAFKSVPKSAVMKVPSSQKGWYKSFFKSAGFKGKVK